MEEDFKNLKLHEQENILNYKAFENKKFNDEDNSFLNTENSFKKFNTNKKFFRAITTNYDINKPKNLEATNQNPEKFKLLLKAQENLKKKILEKQNPKKDNVSGQTIENKLNQNKINLINQDKYSDKKLNYAQEKLSINSLNEITEEYLNGVTSHIRIAPYHCIVALVYRCKLPEIISHYRFSICNLVIYLF